MPLLTANDPGTNQNAWLQNLLETVATIRHQKEAEAQRTIPGAWRINSNAGNSAIQRRDRGRSQRSEKQRGAQGRRNAARRTQFA
jgi:hypothetical protein